MEENKGGLIIFSMTVCPCGLQINHQHMCHLDIVPNICNIFQPITAQWLIQCALPERMLVSHIWWTAWSTVASWMMRNIQFLKGVIGTVHLIFLTSVISTADSVCGRNVFASWLDQETQLPVLTEGSMKVLEQSAFSIQCDIYGFLKHGNSFHCICCNHI